MNNLTCDNCGKQSFFTTIRTHADGKLTDKSNRRLQCLHCKSENLQHIEKPFEGIPALGKFSMLNDEQKKASLKKRSREHAQKTISEKKQEINRDIQNQFKGK